MERTEVRVGDHFYRSWGYDQTNVNFYRVVGLTPSGKSVRLQEVGQVVTHDAGPQVYVVPSETVLEQTWRDPDTDERVTGQSPVVTKRLRPGATPSASWNSYSDVYLWDGTPKMQTGSGWGH